MKRSVNRMFMTIFALGAVFLMVGSSSSADVSGSETDGSERSKAAERTKLKRHQSRYWVWYSPRGWVAAQGAAGIDVSSPDSGRRWAGIAFSGTGFPVTQEQVFSYLESSGGLDSHPVSNVRVTRISPVDPFPGGSRRIFEWTGTRTDLRERVRGKLKIDTFTSVGYGFALAAIVGPSRSWKKDRALLERIAGLIFYRPQEIDPWDRPWE